MTIEEDVKYFNNIPYVSAYGVCPSHSFLNLNTPGSRAFNNIQQHAGDHVLSFPAIVREPSKPAHRARDLDPDHSPCEYPQMRYAHEPQAGV